MKESAIQTRIRLAVGSMPDVRLWRNNTGVLKDSRGVPIRFGLAVGSADLIGLLAPTGRLISLEVKTARGKTTQAQDDWADIVRSMGGFAATVRSAEDAVEAVDRARAGHDS